MAQILIITIVQLHSDSCTRYLKDLCIQHYLPKEELKLIETKKTLEVIIDRNVG